MATTVKLSQLRTKIKDCKVVKDYLFYMISLCIYRELGGKDEKLLEELKDVYYTSKQCRYINKCIRAYKIGLKNKDSIVSVLSKDDATTLQMYFDRTCNKELLKMGLKVCVRGQCKSSAVALAVCSANNNRPMSDNLNNILITPDLFDVKMMYIACNLLVETTKVNYNLKNRIYDLLTGVEQGLKKSKILTPIV